jgi:hypothetical protein
MRSSKNISFSGSPTAARERNDDSVFVPSTTDTDTDIPVSTIRVNRPKYHEERAARDDDIEECIILVCICICTCIIIVLLVLFNCVVLCCVA